MVCVTTYNSTKALLNHAIACLHNKYHFYAVSSYNSGYGWCILQYIDVIFIRLSLFSTEILIKIELIEHIFLK